LKVKKTTPKGTKKVASKTGGVQDKQSVEGSMDCDVAEKIVGAKLAAKDEIFYEIEWRKRYDKSIPSRSFYPSSKVRDMYPQLVLDFIEDKMTTKMRNRK
jgi:hypothetical protein